MVKRVVATIAILANSIGCGEDFKYSLTLGSGPFEVKEVRKDGTPAFAVPGSFLEIVRTDDSLYDILPITFNLVESGKPDTLLVVESECAAACERSGICRDRELNGELNSFSLDPNGPVASTDCTFTDGSKLLIRY
jgi:hypothetical protein